MKKQFLILLAVLLCVGVAVVVRTTWPERGDISQVETDYGDSQFFTMREREDAGKALMKAFQREFPDYILKKVWYVNDLRTLTDDSKLDTDYDVRHIILYSDMTCKPEASGEMEPEKLLRYQWCLGQNDAGRWYLLEYGRFGALDEKEE